MTHPTFFHLQLLLFIVLWIVFPLLHPFCTHASLSLVPSCRKSSYCITQRKKKNRNANKMRHRMRDFGGENEKKKTLIIKKKKKNKAQRQKRKKKHT